MEINKIIHAWKDEEYGQNLSEAELALLPENPAGMLELTDEALEDVAAGGGNGTQGVCWIKIKVKKAQ